MAQAATKKPEETVVKNQKELTAKTQEETVVKNQKETVLISQITPNNWANVVDRVFNSQEEWEKLLLEALENQKQTWEKVTANLTEIGEEQKKLYQEVNELINLNIQNVFGPAASKSVEQWNAQVEEFNKRIQKLTERPYQEGINLINQSFDQFQQFAKNSIEQQQKIREDFKNEFKTAQQRFTDIYEANTKMLFGFFK